MERKIGEIFEYKGEWYQCVNGFECTKCDLHQNKRCTARYNDIGPCSKNSRKDNTPVIFKKLEKVGEPYEFFVKNRGIILLQKYKMLVEPYINRVFCNIHYEDNTIDIELKQNKEDMEGKTNLYEKQTPLQKLMEI